MGRVSYIDSAGLGALLDLYRQVVARSGQLKVFNLQPRAQQLLTMSGLTSIIEHFESEASALQSFGLNVSVA